ncbi:hypothetical protein [Nitratifractor sp.]|uniref:hypothetical protein n=1 Tax=Nitratifractor sp. TaxID=2268144 RepID=UPI0025DB6231|nr:hypothetical protein [Nitratifractor sp.]
MTQLLIHSILPELKDALSTHTRAVLQAAPGAGKTTVVPLALLDAPWLAGKKIVMLEPRRLAARAAAFRMAETLGKKVGETVGYRMRGETKVSPKTRIEVVTEGVLTRLLQSDPELGGVGLVIFALADLTGAKHIELIRGVFRTKPVDLWYAGDLEELEIRVGLREKRDSPVPTNALGVPLGGFGHERQEPYVAPAKVGRNDLCPCGSKKCCL